MKYLKKLKIARYVFAIASVVSFIGCVIEGTDSPTGQALIAICLFTIGLYALLHGVYGSVLYSISLAYRVKFIKEELKTKRQDTEYIRTSLVNLQKEKTRDMTFNRWQEHKERAKDDETC